MDEEVVVVPKKGVTMQNSVVLMSMSMDVIQHVIGFFDFGSHWYHHSYSYSPHSLATLSYCNALDV